VPVEAQTLDRDGTPIIVLLHVLNGRVTELEIYRVDGREIQIPPEAEALTVIVNEGPDSMQ